MQAENKKPQGAAQKQKPAPAGSAAQKPKPAPAESAADKNHAPADSAAPKPKFGVAGNSDSFYAEGHKGTEETPAWLRGRGLEAFEYSFGRGTFMGAEKAGKIAAAARQHGITLSAHAPYYVNFSKADEEGIEPSVGYILRSLEVLRLLGGRRLVFHTASCSKTERGTAFSRTLKGIETLLRRVKDAGFSDMILCPETMGRYSQIGTVEEIAEICGMDDMLIPCADFGHINCYGQGALKTRGDYRRVIDYFYTRAGRAKTDNLHIHFSRIQYGAAGELKHLDFSDTTFGPPFEPLMEVIREYKMSPVVICESSGTMAEDAAAMKKYFDQLGANVVK